MQVLEIAQQYVIMSFRQFGVDEITRFWAGQKRDVD